MDGQPLPHFRSGHAPQINADGKIKLIRERCEKQDLFEQRRQHVEREKVAAGEVFKREQDEDEGGDFQQPEREHGHGVGDEKLQQRGQHQRDGKRERGGEAGRRQDILPETKNENRQRHARHRHKRDAPGKKEAEPIPEVIHRLEQELADVAFADVGGDLPVVFVHRRQHVHDGDEEVIENHAGLGEAGLVAGAGVVRVNRPPERHHREERDEAEQRPREVIEPIREVVLQADVDDVPVFFHAPTAQNLTARR